LFQNIETSYYKLAILVDRHIVVCVVVALCIDDKKSNEDNGGRAYCHTIITRRFTVPNALTPIFQPTWFLPLHVFSTLNFSMHCSLIANTNS